MTKSKPLPPLAVLQEFFSYDPETGLLTRVKKTGRMPAGSPVGNVNPDGYLDFTFNKRRYKTHRVAWLFITGSDPGDLHIDHIDQDTTNNKAENLRLATNAQNAWNTKVATGWQVSKGRYRARIAYRGKQITLGTYDTAEEAHAAYIEACVKLRGAWSPLCYNGEVSPTTND